MNVDRANTDKTRLAYHYIQCVLRKMVSEFLGQKNASNPQRNMKPKIKKPNDLPLLIKMKNGQTSKKHTTTGCGVLNTSVNDPNNYYLNKSGLLTPKPFELGELVRVLWRFDYTGLKVEELNRICQITEIYHIDNLYVVSAFPKEKFSQNMLERLK